MISFVKRAALDVEKYDSCIENSIQSRIYAFSWYLDIVADHWDVLVLNDYEAVMPLPWKQKFGLKYITQPYFCQQLGIFSVEKISKEIQLQFIKKIPLQFLKVALVLNSQNMLIGQPIKKNLFLQLNKNHELLRKKFSKGRKHAIKVAEKNQLMVAETSIQSLIDIQKELYQYEFSEKKLIKLSKQVLQQNTGEVVGVFKDEVLLGGAFFLFQKERIVYLFSAFTEKGRELQAASFLLNYMLKKNENSLLIFDFEGGNISNIATFYNSFGAEVETYSLVTRILL
jgi:lipid II:glycine glycyltransferase (peptidoglycan interpeptide bridge formation enzyme)